MNTSEPDGWTTTSEYFKIRDDESSDSDSDTESDTESELESLGNVGMLKGYMKPKYYKKILIEEELLPD